MANIDNKLIGSVIIGAIENAIRYERIQDGAASNYKVDELVRAHATLTRKLYKSEEMRIEKWLAESIAMGTDFGSFCAVNDILKRVGREPVTLEEYKMYN